MAGLPPLGWYDALLELEKAGEDGLRPFQLKERLLLPQSGTSRLLDRMERARLIRRTPHDNDARGQIVSLTEEGAALRQRMWSVYEKFLREAVERALRVEELHDLSALLGRLQASSNSPQPSELKETR